MKVGFAKAFGLLSLLVFSACAVAPKNQEEARAFAKDKFTAREVRMPAKRYAGLAAEFRAYAKKCIPETVVIDHHGRTMDSRVSHFIHFKWDVVETADHTELFVQKDIGTLLNAPSGGMYYVVVQADRPAGAEFPITYRWMDSYAFRGQDLAAPLESHLDSPSAHCPNLADDSDFRDKF
jgi:hypothetical protein